MGNEADLTTAADDDGNPEATASAATFVRTPPFLFVSCRRGRQFDLVPLCLPMTATQREINFGFVNFEPNLRLLFPP